VPQRGRFTSIRRKYRRKRFNNTFTTSAKPVRYGPGKNVSVINRFHDLSGNDITRISINSELMNNTEFSMKSSLFKYFKIKYIKAVFYPVNGQEGTILVNLSWNQVSATRDYLEKDDSTKILTAYRVKTKVFTWLPVRMVLNVNSTSQDPPTNFINPSEYISVDRIVDLPGWLFIFSNNSHIYQVNVEIKIEFRGNDFFNTASKIEKVLGNKNDKIEDREGIIEEDEDKNSVEEEIEELRKRIEKLSVKGVVEKDDIRPKNNEQQ
jgi:hypothetical protein